MVELPVGGNPRLTRWVLKVGLNPGGLQGGSGEQYFIGTFDGTQFVNDNPATTLWTDYGKDCYCALPFNGKPPGQGAVTIGWMSNWQYADKVPTSPWRGQMTIPRSVALQTFPDGIRLVQKPVAALATLRDQHIGWHGTDVAALNHAMKAFRPQSFELRITVASSNATVGWKLLADDGAFTEVGYDNARQALFVDRTHSGLTGFSRDFPARTEAPLALGHNPLNLTILVDRSTVEVFAQGGRVAISNLVYPPAGVRGIEFNSHRAKPGEIHLDLWSIRSTWNQ